MFDLTSSKLLILGIVALIVVGPKELPFLLRTIGKYVGMIRRQANEFRSQFDEAMREAELDSIKKDLENVARDTENTIRSAQSSFEQDIHATTQEIDKSVQQPAALSSEPAHTPAHTYDPLNGLDAPPAEAPPAIVSEVSTADAAPLTEHNVIATVETTQATSELPVPSLQTAPVQQQARPELAKTGT